MKKILSAVCLTVILFTLIFISCKKDPKFSVQETSLINSAKEWYNIKAKTESSNSFRLEPQWEDAKISNSSGGEQMVIVPANSENKTNNPKYGMVTSFVFRGHAKKVDTGNIVQILGESNYIKEQGPYIYQKYKNRSIDGLKNGALILHDINHNYLYGYSIKDGVLSTAEATQLFKAGSNSLANSVFVNGTRVVITKSRVSLSSSRAMSNTSPSTFSTQPESNCIDWYWTTWNTTTGQVISEQYLYTTCQPNPTGGSSTTETSLNSPPPCPQSFHFVTKISGSMTNPQYEGGWQIAAIKEIRLRFASTAAEYPSYTIEMPLLYFGLPVVKKNIDPQGNVTYEQYTYEKAQQLASLAVKAAELAAYVAYKEHYPKDQVHNTYRAALISAIATYGGTVSETPGLGMVILTKDITVAEYPDWLGC